MREVSDSENLSFQSFFDAHRGIGAHPDQGFVGEPACRLSVQNISYPKFEKCLASTF
jgi:hypothetical protein